MKTINLQKMAISASLLSLFWIITSCVYYFYHRNIKFEEVNRLYDIEFRLRMFQSPTFISTPNKLFEVLIDWRDKAYGYDSTVVVPYNSELVESLADSMDFDKYDYIISYNRELGEIIYAPYLSDCIYDLIGGEKTFLIPLFKGNVTDFIYIYRIRKIDYEEFCPAFLPSF